MRMTGKIHRECGAPHTGIMPAPASAIVSVMMSRRTFSRSLKLITASATEGLSRAGAAPVSGRCTARCDCAGASSCNQLGSSIVQPEILMESEVTAVLS